MDKNFSPKSQAHHLAFKGGPVFHLLQRLRKANRIFNLLPSHIWIVAFLAWLPLFPLILFNSAIFQTAQIPFIFDIELHIRLLLVVPILIAAEKYVQNKLSPLVDEFISSGLIGQNLLPDYEEIIKSTGRLLNSRIIEITLLILAFTVLHIFWLSGLTPEVSTWYAVRNESSTIFSPAGYWYSFISLPLLRFLLLRWYFRVFVWYRFLWKVSRLPLKINSLHPDNVGGLGILDDKLLAMLPIWFCHSLFLSALIANRIWHAGASLSHFVPEIIALLILLLIVILLPVTFFMPALFKNKNNCLIQFGGLAGSYVEQFWMKWIEGNKNNPELLGNSDVQALADFGSSYENVLNTRTLIVRREILIGVVIALVLPLLPLLLFIYPADEILKRLIRIIL